MRWIALALGTLLVGVAPSPALAFCRTTTCSPSTESCPVDEHGCVTRGLPLHWPAPPTLVFRFQRQHSALLVPEETTAAVRAAFYRWSDVVCPDGHRPALRFLEGEELSIDKSLAPSAPRPEPFGIYFRDRGWPHVDRDEQSALTTLDFAPSSGAILYADIEVNTTDWLFSTRDLGEGIDLQTAITHEVGHFIGLAHSREPNSIMAPGLCDSGDRCARDRVSSRRLGADDIAAVCALYPAAAESPEAEPPRPEGACSVHVLGTPPGDVVLAFFTFLAFASQLRTRRGRRASTGRGGRHLALFAKETSCSKRSGHRPFS